ncbi:MAG: hypothetical protein AAF645_19925, partial [Myxococcota bacterium]
YCNQPQPALAFATAHATGDVFDCVDIDGTLWLRHVCRRDDYEAFGRPWERAVWLRARPVAGDRALGGALLRTLDPFVFPRRADPGIATTMRQMVQQSRAELARDVSRDVKLGVGGIREAEFFVQTLQLVWGGLYPELRVAGTLEAARRLEASGLIQHRERAQLEQAWVLLRRVEHRLQLSRGFQTHEYPEDPLFAHSLGFESLDAFERSLRDHQADVSTLFASLRDATEAPTHSATLVEKLARGEAPSAETLKNTLGVRDADEAASHLARWRRHPDLPLGGRGLRLLPSLAECLMDEVKGSADPDLALRSLTAFLQRGGAAYGRMLTRQPRLRRRLIGLLGASPSLGQALVGFPDSLGMLLAAERPDRHAILADHQGANEEALVPFLRERRRRWTLALALAHAGGQYDLDGASRLLTSLAEAQLQAALRVHARGPFAVVALGKLGSEELGFGGDLDLVFLYEGDQELAAKTAVRLTRALTRPDREGPGYTVDTRLRPSGQQGTLVSSLAGFERYHAQRAEGWERLALVRSRVVAATDTAFGQRCEALTTECAFSGSLPSAERLRTLRRRMEEEIGEERRDRYHPKVGFGTLVDIEFLAQYTQMKEGPKDAERPRHTDEVLVRLGSLLGGDDTAHLRRSRRFFRDAAHARRFLDPKGDPRVRFGGPGADAIARLIGLQDRDEVRAASVMERTWKDHAQRVRALFEATFGAVGTRPPWSTGS